jgi:tRNA-dihydrouridine synthase B
MNFLNTPLNIGKLQLKNRVFLAPLAGVSDIPFRRLCQEFGAGLTYVEMLSATALAHKNPKTYETMARHPEEQVLGVQMTGALPHEMAQAVSLLEKEGFETIDINMGCPVKKVVNAGCGSAFLKDSPRISLALQACRNATHLPLSAKFRLGDTRATLNMEDTTERVIAAHLNMLTVHGRTRSENYSTPCDVQSIQKCVAIAQKKNTSIVTVGNGDLFSFACAENMQQKTQCDAVMISRGALGNPWIFQEILKGKPVNPSFEEWLETVLRYLHYQEQHYGNTKLAAILARKHMLWMAKGFSESKKLRHALGTIETLEQAKEILKIYSKNKDKKALRSRVELFENSQNTREENTKLLLPKHQDPKHDMDRHWDRGVGCEDLKDTLTTSLQTISDQV